MQSPGAYVHKGAGRGAGGGAFSWSRTASCRCMSGPLDGGEAEGWCWGWADGEVWLGERVIAVGLWLIWNWCENRCN